MPRIESNASGGSLFALRNCSLSLFQMTRVPLSQFFSVSFFMDDVSPYHVSPDDARTHTHTFFAKPSLIDFKGVARWHQGTVAVITQRLHGCYIDDDTLAVKECHAQRNVGVTHPHAVALVCFKNKEHGVVGGQGKAVHESLLACRVRVGNLSVKNMIVNAKRHAGIARAQ